MNYYNDIDPGVCAWLEMLIEHGMIAPGKVDNRSICDVTKKDLAGFIQCHFFCGIGGWPFALDLAGWPRDRPVWTGSCPCQPFSAAGKREGQKDERHLWPELMRLIRECRPEAVFGEQVASSEVVGTQLEADFVEAVRIGDFAKANKLANKLAKSNSLHYHERWIDGVHADLEAEGYAARFDVLGAHSVAAPHERQRLYWVGSQRWKLVQPDIAGLEGFAGNEPDRNRPGRERADADRPVAAPSSRAGWLADTGREHCERYRIDGVVSSTAEDIEGKTRQRERGWNASGDGCETGSDARLGNAENQRRQYQPTVAGVDGTLDGASECVERTGGSSDSGGLADDTGEGLERSAGASIQRHGTRPAFDSATCGLADATGKLIDGRYGKPKEEVNKERRESTDDSTNGFWSDYRIIHCRDNKRRRVEAQCEHEPMAHGIPALVDALRVAGLSENEIQIAQIAGPLAPPLRGRTLLLKGYGNAIVPQVAAEFLKAYMEGAGDE